MKKDWRLILDIIKELDKDREYIIRSLNNLCKDWNDDNLAIYNVDCKKYVEDYRKLMVLQSMEV